MTALELLKARAAATPLFTPGGLNYLPHALLDAVAAVMEEYAALKVMDRSACDVTAVLIGLEKRVLTGEPHPSHVWNESPLNCCIHCEAFHGMPASLLPCDPSKLAGRLEFCCSCAAEYPRSDLIAGEIYCPSCRTLSLPNGTTK